MKQTLLIVTCLFALAAGFPSSSQETLQPGIPAFLFDQALQRQSIQAEQSLIPLLTRQKREQVHFVNEYAGQPSYTRGCTSRGCGGGYREYISSPVSPCRGSQCSGNGGYREYISSPVSPCRGSQCSGNGGYREYISPVSPCRGSQCSGGYREYQSTVPILCGGEGCNNAGYRQYTCRGSGCRGGGFIRETGSGCSRAGCTK